MKRTEDLTRAYLLGALDGEERDAVEHRLFMDDDYLARVEKAEEQLIGEYVRGTLSAGERTRFEDHFLASPRRRRSTELTRALMQIGASSKQAEKQLSGRKWLPAVALTAATVAMVFAGLSGWLAIQLRRERDAASVQQRQRAAVEEEASHSKGANSGDAGPNRGSASAAILSFAIAPGMFRDQSERSIRVASDVPAVRFSLRTDETLTSPRYAVAVRGASGDEVWRSDATRLGMHEAAVLIPGAILQPGQYLLTLATHSKAGTATAVDDYSFRVIR